MILAKAGDIVRVHYTGTLDDSTVFDSSAGREPLEFVLGAGMVIPGFDAAVTGMVVGNKKQVRIPAEEAYGAAREEMKFSVPLSNLPPDLQVEVGDSVSLSDDQGHSIPARVTALTDSELHLDANHRLAGQALTFDLELVSIAGGQ